MVKPNWTWDTRWFSLARLMRDGEVIGEVQLFNGTWLGFLAGRMVCSSTSADTYSAAQAAMAQLAEVAMRTAM